MAMRPCEALGVCAPMPCGCCWHAMNHEHVEVVGPMCPFDDDWEDDDEEPLEPLTRNPT